MNLRGTQIQLMTYTEGRSLDDKHGATIIRKMKLIEYFKHLKVLRLSLGTIWGRIRDQYMETKNNNNNKKHTHTHIKQDNC